MRAILFLAFTGLALAAAPAHAQSFGMTSEVVGDGEIVFGQPTSDRDPGTVYVFRRDGGGWAEVASLRAPEPFPGDRFGAAIAVSGDYILVGAFEADSGRGAAYLMRRDESGTWSHVARLAPAERRVGERVGAAVAFDGGLALVATASSDSMAGAVYSFRRDDDGAWSEAGRLEVEGLAVNAGYGSALALSAETAFVGAANADSAAGAVFAFRHGDDGWGEPARISAPESRSAFGTTLALVDDLLLVGAPRLGMSRGGVVVLREEGGEWTETARLLPFEASPRTLFGGSIAVEGDEVWIGAPGDDRFRGSVYSFRRDGDGWTEAVRIEVPDDVRSGDFLATSVAVGTGAGAAGVPRDDNGMGTAVIWERSDEGWVAATRVHGTITGMDPVVGAPVECGEEGRADRFACRQVDLLSFLPVESLGGERGAELNDVWGWTDPETGREYALVGRTDGMSFVEVTDPHNPVFVGQLPKTAGTPSAAWRDVKVYENHAFIVADNSGEHGMQIFDLTRLRDAGMSPPAVFEPDARYEGLHSAHNIVINTDTGFAYAVGVSGGGDTCGGGLHMIDIRDPLNPMFVGCFADPATGRQGTGSTHDAQCVVYHGPDTEHEGREICFGSNETGLSIADVTDKQNPVALSVAEYPNVAYTHQAWLTEDHRYLLLGDELDEMQGLVEHTRTLVWDVTDLDDPVLIKEYFNPNTGAVDHNLYIVGDTVYQSNYVTGLRVLDIGDIENPEEVGFFDTVPYGDDAARFDGSWSNYPFFESGTVVVTSGSEGLFLLRYVPQEERPIS